MNDTESIKKYREGSVLNSREMNEKRKQTGE